MTDLDPERFSLRQAAQARDDFAQIVDELDFVKEQLARLPTRRDQAFTPLRMMVGSAILSAGLVILWFEVFWRRPPLEGMSQAFGGTLGGGAGLV